jgi:2,4-dienoyl-CoA reductase-like NADH-dependent reductase (Old Yellow Enzyme family)/thioredoxin reductase
MPTTDFSPLFNPIKIGKLALKNRIVMAPMCSRLPTADGEVTPALIDHYRVRAKGGAAMLIIEFARIDDDLSSAEWGMLSASSDRFSVGLGLLAETITLNGARACLQLAHAGRQSSYAEPCLSPSAIPDLMYQELIGERYQVREITIKEIAGVIQSFAEAAMRAKIAGFEAIEIHGAHGYLPGTFLSSYGNHRTDKYGGSLENRARVSLDIVRETRALVGPNFPIIYRYNGDDFVRGGFEIEEAKELALMLEDVGIDAHHVSGSIGESWEECEAPIYVPRGNLAHLASAVREVATLPVIAVGAIDVPMAADLVRDGKADIVAIGRGFLSDTEIPNKAAKGEVRAIRPCIRCNESCLNGEMVARPQRCDVNFQCEREGDYPLVKADERKRVLVIGGGAAGMEAARVACLRGHEVTMFERTNQLGGQLQIAALLGFKDDLRALMDNMAYDVQRLDIDIRMNTEATPELAKSLNPDRIIVAAGVQSKYRDVPGVDLSHVSYPVDLLESKATSGNRVIVVGGGWLGCDISVYLARLGKEVMLTTVKEAAHDLIPNLEPFSRKVFMDMMESSGVVVKGSHRIAEITPGGASFTGDDDEVIELEADTVVPAWGFRPDKTFNDVAHEIAPSPPFIGDCVRLGNLRSCVWPGFLAAYEI